MDAEQRARTLAWAARFRDSAAQMTDNPPEGVHPILWKAQRDSYIIEAERLEAEAGGCAAPR